MINLVELGDFISKVLGAGAVVIGAAAPIAIVYLQAHRTEKKLDKQERVTAAEKDETIRSLRVALVECIERNGNQ